MENFASFNLQPELMQALAKLNFVTPTPIQAAAIPVALEGADILGTAQTGTGKTGAFGIPLIAYLLNNPEATALVMTPTRELAAQVMEMLRKMLGQSKIRSALLIGGEAMPKQFQQLRSNPRLIVGTPGRINDHLQRRSLKLDNTGFLVLDETDRMLDMGFGIQIDAVLEHMPEERQTLLFSATLPANILKLSGKYLADPVRISTGALNAPAKHVKQETVQIAEADKYDSLLTQLDQREGSIIVFVKTKWGADKMSKKLRGLNYAADTIHGDLRQNQRDRAIRAFRNKNTRILVATDVAARGLDIPHIEHVINYDLPQVAEDYIHRIGRTARAGAEGEAINLVSPQDGKKWTAIRRILNPNEKPERAERSGQKNKRPAGRNASFKQGSKPKRNDAFAYEPKREAQNAFGYDSKPKTKGHFKDGQKPKFNGEYKPKFNGDAKPKFRGEEKPRYNGDSKPKFNGEYKPKFNGDAKPKFRGEEKPRYNGDSKPKFNGEYKPKFNGDAKPKFRGEEKRGAQGKPAFGGEAKQGAKPKFGGKHKPAAQGGKKHFGGGKAYGKPRKAFKSAA